MNFYKIVKYCNYKYFSSCKIQIKELRQKTKVIQFIHCPFCLFTKFCHSSQVEEGTLATKLLEF